MNRDSKIYVAGHSGLVGSAIYRLLEGSGYKNITKRTHTELDLTDQRRVRKFFKAEKPEYVFLCAAKVGGIGANSNYQADFIYNNIMIASNIIHASFESGVKKLLNLGTSCIFPKMAPQPLKEGSLLTGPLEPTNEGYAVAKIAAIKLCRYFNEQYGTNFLSVMPPNLYGPGDNFDFETSHAFPALLRKIHEAKIEGRIKVTLWGDGTPHREFMYVEDLAEVAFFLMEKYNTADIGEFINVGTGSDITIKELALMMKDVVGYQGSFGWDLTKPNGTPKKLLDVSRIHALGWKAGTSLADGIKKTYEWYKSHVAKK